MEEPFAFSPQHPGKEPGGNRLGAEREIQNLQRTSGPILFDPAPDRDPDRPLDIGARKGIGQQGEGEASEEPSESGLALDLQNPRGEPKNERFHRDSPAFLKVVGEEPIQLPLTDNDGTLVAAKPPVPEKNFRQFLLADASVLGSVVRGDGPLGNSEDRRLEEDSPHDSGDQDPHEDCQNEEAANTP